MAQSLTRGRTPPRLGDRRRCVLAGKAVWHRPPLKTSPEGWQAAYGPALNFPNSYNIPELATDFPDWGDFVRK
jgi:hypothetical protein